MRPRGPRRQAVGRIIRVVRRSTLVTCPASSNCTLNYHLNGISKIRQVHRLQQLSSGRRCAVIYRSFTRLDRFIFIDGGIFHLVGTRAPNDCAFVLPTAHRIPHHFVGPGGHAIKIQVPPGPIIRTLIAALKRPLLSDALLVPNSRRPVSSN